jgi:uncharacterized membrane protein YeaQ/YmgE (transglycosylase-associated protein family)
MVWLASMFVIGLVVAGLISSFTGSSTLRPLWTGVLGVVGGVAGGFLATPLSVRLFGEGPEYIVSLIGAAIMAFVLVLVFRLINR